MTSLEALVERAKTARARLAAWDERHSVKGFDHGMLNLSLRSRNGKAGIDGLARQRAVLREAVTKAETRLHRAQAVPRIAAEKAAVETVHATIDLKAMHGGKTEVLWTLNGQWLKVIRWNKKSVTVRMAGERDTIPHTQIAGTR